jgi:hypothetical protein
MFAGFYTFEQILQGVKTKTGIQNLRNMYEDIRIMICNAEREINPYAGHLVLKKYRVYKNSTSRNNLYNGKRIIKPADFVQLNKMVTCNEGLCDGEFYETVNHIVICNSKVDRPTIQFAYWAYQSDRNGNPVTTRNHAEAVEDYIVWMLQRQKFFVGETGLSNIREFERIFKESSAQACGEDFFPDSVQLANMQKINNAEKVQLYDIQPGIDGCYEKICMNFFEETNPEVDVVIDPDNPIIVNTPPTLSSNSHPLVPLYRFRHTDFIQDYFDEQNHLPGKVIIKSDINNLVGKIKKIPSFDQQTQSRSSIPYVPSIPSLVFPLEIPIEEIRDYVFQINQNLNVINQNLIEYPGISNIQETREYYLNKGYSETTNGIDIIFRKEESITVPIDTNIYVFLDRTSMNITDAINIKESLSKWFKDYLKDVDNYEGSLYIIPVLNENWVSLGSFPWTGKASIELLETDNNFNSLEQKSIQDQWRNLSILPENINSYTWESKENAIVFAFIDESFPDYHSNNISDSFIGGINQPTLKYINDHKDFVDIHDNNYNFFRGLLYPVIKNFTGQSASLVLQAISAIEGKILNQSKIDSYNTPINIQALLTENPYMGYSLTGYPKISGLKNYGWKGIFDKVAEESLFTSDTFLEELSSVIDTEINKVISTIEITGTVLRNDTGIEVPSMCFPFSVKEQSEDELESLEHVFCFTLNRPLIETKIWSFQFNNTLYDISDYELITEDYLENSAFEESENLLINGKNISLPNTVGRFGFAIQNSITGVYNIFDLLGNDITNIIFDKIRIEERNLDIYISKEYYISENIFIKFIKV